MEGHRALLYVILTGKDCPSRHLTSVGRQIDVRLRRHNDVGFRLILKVCLTSKTDVILTSKTDVILTSEKQRWFDVSNVTSGLG